MKTNKKIILGQTIVEILWEDAWSDPGYYTIDELSRERPYHIESVGIVLRNDKSGITTARERMANGRYRTIQHIARAMIRKVEVLRA